MLDPPSVPAAVETARKKSLSLKASSLSWVRTPLHTSIPNGSTWQIASATFAAVIPPARKTGTGAASRVEGSKNFTALVVDRNLKGVSVGTKEKKMGLRATDTASVIFEDVRVPIKNRIGGEGEGFQIFMKAMQYGRPIVGAQAVGLAQGAFELARNYAKERKQFGKSISNFQAIRFMLADMAMNIEAARLLVYQSAYYLDKGEPSIKLSSFAKCFSSDMAMKVTTDAVQVFGGYGFIRDYLVEKYMRDAKILQIYEGTNQIQRIVIAKEILAY